MPADASGGRVPEDGTLNNLILRNGLATSKPALAKTAVDSPPRIQRHYQPRPYSPIAGATYTDPPARLFEDDPPEGLTPENVSSDGAGVPIGQPQSRHSPTRGRRAAGYANSRWHLPDSLESLRTIGPLVRHDISFWPCPLFPSVTFERECAEKWSTDYEHRNSGSE